MVQFTLADYLAKIPRQNADKPVFRRVLSALLQPGLDVQSAAESIVPAFQLDEAVGVQLDTDGVIIGRNRKVSVPLEGVYFSFDTPGLGFDQGVWQGPFDPSSGIVSLDDDTYRTLLQAKAATNVWDGSNEQAFAILASVFNTPGTYVFLDDTSDLKFSIVVSGTLPPAIIIGVLLQGFLPLKPVTVRQNIAITSVDGAPVFGFDVDNEYIGGFDHGAWAVSDPSLIEY